MCRIKKLISKRYIVILLGLAVAFSLFLHWICCLTTIIQGESLTTAITTKNIPIDSLTFQENTVYQTTQRGILWNKPEDNPQFFTPRESRLTPLDFKILIHDSHVCKVPPFLLILVISLHHHTEERRAIRNTWGRVAYGHDWPGKQIHNKVKILFLFGKAGTQFKYSQTVLQNESKSYKDIVMFDFEESYFNLTYKVLMGIKWVKTFCPLTKFVMKTDEDVFIDIPHLMNKLHTTEWTTKISGLLFTVDKTYRTGKYAVSPDVYPFQYYPPHVKGNLYFMPTYIAFKLLNVSEFMPYVNMEDVHITGILAIVANVNKYQRLTNEEFSPMGIFRSCEFTNRQMLAAAYIRPQQAKDIWTTIEKPGLCSTHYRR